MKFIVLDSTPLGLLFTRIGNRQGDECRDWLTRNLAQGVRFVVPEIIEYELRRELLRLGNTEALAQMEAFVDAEADRRLVITSDAMRLAAELWADARKQGNPTADPHALDIDVILSAQVPSAGFQPSQYIVATSNLGHLTQFVPAKIWRVI